MWKTSTSNERSAPRGRLARAAATTADAGEDDSIAQLLKAMGGRTQPPSAAATFAARTSGVGEECWDPEPNLQAAGGSGSTVVPSHSSALRVALETLRGRALRRLQAAVEDAVLAECGDAVAARLEMLSRVTLRNGNGFVDRWLASRRKAEVDPLLPNPHRTSADVPGVVAELEAAGAIRRRRRRRPAPWAAPRPRRKRGSLGSAAIHPRRRRSA